MASNVVQNEKHSQMNGAKGESVVPYENGTSKDVDINDGIEPMDGSGDNPGDISSDPEMKAEVQYAKEHGLDPNAIPLRQKLRLLKRTKSVEGKPVFFQFL